MIKLPAERRGTATRHRVAVRRERREAGALSLGQGIRVVPDVPVFADGITRAITRAAVVPRATGAALAAVIGVRAVAPDPDQMPSPRRDPRQPTRPSFPRWAKSSHERRGYGRQLSVRSARKAGASWSQIGAALGTSKQTEWEAHSRWIDEQAAPQRDGHWGWDETDTAAALALAGRPEGEETE
ncbi:Chromate resistance protein ChrB [Streptomyces scopuliridis]